MPYEFIPHTADIKVRVKAKSLKQLFLESFEALNSIILENEPEKIKSKKTKTIKIKSPDKHLDSLFYNFLEEFLYLLDAKHFVVSEIKITNLDMHKSSLTAVVKGDSSSYYNVSNKIKSPTYNDLKIKRDKKLKFWQVTFVLDV